MADQPRPASKAWQRAAWRSYPMDPHRSSTYRRKATHSQMRLLWRLEPCSEIAEAALNARPQLRRGEASQAIHAAIVDLAAAEAGPWGPWLAKAGSR